MNRTLKDVHSETSQPNRNGRNLGTEPSFQLQKLNIQDSIYHEMMFRYKKQCIKWSSWASMIATEGSDKTVENREFCFETPGEASGISRLTIRTIRINRC